MKLLRAAAAFVASFPLMAQTYTVAPADGASFQLEVEKTGFLRGKVHRFNVERYRGQLQYDAAAPTRSTLSLEIEGSSLICKDTWLDAKDLKKVQNWTFDEMLKVKQYPKLTFTLANAVSTGMGKFDATGTLSMRGSARPVKVSVTVKDETGKLRLDGRSTFRMSDFGMKPPTAALGTIGTKDEVVVSFSIFATQ